MSFFRAPSIVIVDSLRFSAVLLCPGTVQVAWEYQTSRMLRFVAGKPGDLSDASLCFAIYMGFGFIFSLWEFLAQLNLFCVLRKKGLVKEFPDDFEVNYLFSLKAYSV